MDNPPIVQWLRTLQEGWMRFCSESDVPVLICVCGNTDWRCRSAAEEMDAMGGGGRRGDPAALFRAAAQLMTREGGPNVAAMEFSGWDTHANQGISAASAAKRARA